MISETSLKKDVDDMKGRLKQVANQYISKIQHEHGVGVRRLDFEMINIQEIGNTTNKYKIGDIIVEFDI